MDNTTELKRGLQREEKVQGYWAQHIIKMKQKEEEGQEAANSTNVTPKPCPSPSSIFSGAQTSLLTA